MRGIVAGLVWALLSSLVMASAASALSPETALRASTRIALQGVGASASQLAERHREKWHSYDGEASGSTLSAKGGAQKLLGPGQTAAQRRASDGIATGGYGLTSDLRMLGSHGSAARIPGEVAEKLRGRSFSSFDEFRGEFWKVMGESRFASRFDADARNVFRMRAGAAPKAHSLQAVGGNTSYALHHVQPIHAGGGVFDLDNLLIVSPRFHAEILDPVFHYAR